MKKPKKRPKTKKAALDAAKRQSLWQEGDSAWIGGQCCDDATMWRGSNNRVAARRIGAPGR